MFDFNNKEKKLHKSPFKYDLETHFLDSTFCDKEIDRFKTSFYQLKSSLNKGLHENDFETVSKLMHGYNSLGKIFRRGKKSNIS